MTKISKLKNVRVRIAPSPTGFLHIGTARTALSNFLFAKQNNGKFILRIEDTDKIRSEEKYEQSITDGLKWLGIEWDEGPDIGGSFAPYRQSERSAIYEKYIKKLFKEGKLYHCFCSAEDLKAERDYLMSQSQPPHYSGKCKKLTREEIEENLSNNKPFAFRFKTPTGKIAFNDMLRGKIEQDGKNFGDMVVAKNLSEPLYNLAVVIDDFEMQISHAIRGEDHISNTPKQIILAKALGIDPPKYLHLPLILATDKSKMSKRHGAVSIVEYKEQGYLPEAIVNFLALLGWNPGDEREVFTKEELIKEFSTDKMHKSGAVFNIVKLEWLNGHYIRDMRLNSLTELCIPYLVETGLIVPLWGQKAIIEGAYKMPFDVIEYEAPEIGETVKFEYIESAIKLYQERLKKLSEISDLVDYLFKKELDYDPQLLIWKKMDNEEVKNSLDISYTLLDNIKEGSWTEKNITKLLIDKANEVGNRGELLWPLRVALSGKKSSAGPFEITTVLGKQKTLERINKAKQKL